MAESVDALVSNTSGATRAGSTPALGTQTELPYRSSVFYYSDAQHFITITNANNKKEAGHKDPPR